MRILALDQFSQPGGGQQVLLELLRAARDRGWEAFAGLPGGGPLSGSVRAIGFQTFRLDCGPSIRSAREPAGFLRDSMALSRQIRSVAAAYSPDIVYLNGPRLLPAVAVACPRAPVLFHSHNRVPAAARLACGLALRRLRAHVIGVCQFTAAQWRPFLGPDDVRVVYNGVPENRIPSSRIMHPTVGCIGRIAPEKGQLEFVKAARLIHTALPDCRFTVTGGVLFDDAASIRYEALVRSEAAGLPVTFCGWADGAAGALREIDLLLVPSGPAEATTRVIPEAWAAGVPVIAFASGGIPEIVRHGVNGFLAGSADQMARIAIRLLTSGREDAMTVAERGRDCWSRRFRLETAQQAWLEAITNASLARAATSARRTPPDGLPQERGA